MIWIPLVCAGLLGLLLVLVQLRGTAGLRLRVRRYRAIYLQLISRLERLTVTANELQDALKKPRSANFAAQYEHALKVLETLLLALKALPAFGSEPNHLKAASELLRSCETEFRVLVGRARLSGHDETELKTRATIGCYFCSKPFTTTGFSLAKVRIDDEVLAVHSCNVCRDELARARRVKVLHFMVEGKPTHWSKVSSYRPVEQYWTINLNQPPLRRAKLELVYHDDGSN